MRLLACGRKMFNELYQRTLQLGCLLSQPKVIYLPEKASGGMNGTPSQLQSLADTDPCYGMGTEIVFTVNLLGSRAQKNSIDLTFVGGLEHIEDRELWKNSTKIGADCQLLDPMDRRLDRNSIESIKKTMQKHEDTFKQQVLELHRLYNVQKLMMDEFQNELKQKKSRPPISLGLSQSDSHHHRPKNQTAYELDFRFPSVREDLCSRDRIAGANSGETTRMTVREGFNLERPAEDNSLPRIPRAVDEDRVGGPSSSNMATLKSSTMSMDGCDYDESQVELSLSIGGSQTKKRAKSRQYEVACSDSQSTGTKELHYYSSASLKSDRAEECSDLTNPISSSSVTFDQERKKPHWLFQGLNLK